MEPLLNQDILALIARDLLMLAMTTKKLLKIWKENNTIYYDTFVCYPPPDPKKYRYYKDNIVQKTGNNAVKKYLVLYEVHFGSIENDRFRKSYPDLEYLLIDCYTDFGCLKHLIKGSKIKKVTLVQEFENYGYFRYFSYFNHNQDREQQFREYLRLYNNTDGILSFENSLGEKFKKESEKIKNGCIESTYSIVK